jgi:hypothetical protein
LSYETLFSRRQDMERELWLALYQFGRGLDCWEVWKLGHYL